MNLLGKRSELPMRRMVGSAVIGICFIFVATVTSTNFGLALVNAQSGPEASLAPKGWFLAGSKPANYDSGVDVITVNNGQPSAFLRSTVSNTEGFGSLMQQISARNYMDKRIRLRAWVKSQDVAAWAGLWMRVDKGQTTVAFDNMAKRPIKGTQSWQMYEVVLNVPQDSTGIAFGILLTGTGEVWMSDVDFESVGNEVRVTDMLSHSKERPNNPVNLKFTE